MTAIKCARGCIGIAICPAVAGTSLLCEFPTVTRMAYEVAYGNEKRARRRVVSIVLAEQAGFEPAVGY
jgi:hypothetical protein